MLKKIRFWLTWWRIKHGATPTDMVLGAGYYLTVSIFGDPRKHLYSRTLANGKTGLYKLLRYTTFHDPGDMVKESEWHFVGYKGSKLIKNCTFKEYLSIYCKNTSYAS